MNMNLYIVIGILLWHFISDFVLQTEWQAENKSKDNYALIDHTLVYGCSWIVPLLMLDMISNNNTPWNVLTISLFVMITTIIHTIQDWFTSRLNNYLWKTKQTHNFFVSIGFDQFCHYVQLLFTFYYLSQ